MPNPQKKLNVRLVELAREGNQEAFATLYNEYQLGIYGYLAARVGKDDAYDLVQDTFIKAFSKLPNLQDLSKFVSWLYRIAQNCAYDHLRGKHRNNGQSIEDMQEKDMPMSHIDIAEHIAERELVQQTFAYLPLKLRDCLLLNVIGGLSPREIAPIMELNESSVNNYLCKARRSFRERFLYLKQQSGVTEREVEVDGEH
jgi:RNA polymerase sigma-70 factor (ECF subfamily)